MFGLSGFALGLVAGGAIIFLCPGLGAGGNAVWKNVIKPFFKNNF